MYQLERLQFIPRPIAEVFDFFADASNLERITPPWLHFKIITPLPIEMHTGTLIEYRLRLSGIPIFWRTRIEEFEPNCRFVDSQIRGPYRRWWHTHTFREVTGGTEMRDHVEYEMPAGPLGKLVHALLTKRQLQAIFDYRWKVIEEVFPA